MIEGEAKARNALDRHAAYFARLLKERTAQLHGANQKAALSEITLEFENIRAAWNWSLECENPIWLEAMLECLRGYAELRGRFLETLELFKLGHQRIDNTWQVSAPELHSRLLAGHGEALFRLGRNNEAQPMLEAALSDLEKLEGDHHMPVLLVHAELLFRRGELNRAKLEAQTVIDSASLKIHRLEHHGLKHHRLKHHRLTDALQLKGSILAQQGEYETANIALERTLTEYEAAGNRIKYADTLIELCIVWHNSGSKSLNEIGEATRQALEIQREFGDNQGMISTLSNLGYMHGLRNEYEQAWAAYRESLSLATRFGLNNEILRNRFRMAGLEQDTDQFERAYGQFQVCAAQARAQQNHWILVRSIGSLGEIALELERFDQARAHFQESIRLAWDADETPTVLTLLSIISYLEETSDPVWAQQLASLIHEHPASQARDRADAHILLERLALVTQSAETLSLETVVKRLLEQEYPV